MSLQSLCAKEPFFSQPLDADGMRNRMIDGKLIRLAGHLVREMGVEATPLKARLLLVAWLIFKYPEEVDGNSALVEAARQLAMQIEAVREGRRGCGKELNAFSKLFLEWQARDKEALEKQLKDHVSAVEELQRDTADAPEWEQPLAEHLQQLQTAVKSLSGPNPLSQPRASADLSLLHDYYLEGDKFLAEPELVPFELAEGQWQEFIQLCSTQLCSLLKGPHRQQVEESLRLPIPSHASFIDRLTTIHTHMTMLCAPVRDEQIKTMNRDPATILWMLRCMNKDQLLFHIRLIKPHLREVLVDMERKQWRDQPPINAHTLQLLRYKPADLWSELLLSPDDGFQLAYLDAKRLCRISKELHLAIRLAWIASRYKKVNVERLAILLQDTSADLAAELRVSHFEFVEDALWDLLKQRAKSYCKEQLNGKSATLNLACANAEEMVRQCVEELKPIFNHHVHVYGALYLQ